jgi:hypothetical protein
MEGPREQQLPLHQREFRDGERVIQMNMQGTNQLLILNLNNGERREIRSGQDG